MAWHSDPYISGQVTATVLNWQETEEGKDILVGGGSEDKASACNAEDPGLILRLGRSPGEGNGNPLQYSHHGQSSLAGYSPWGHKALDMTEQVNKT